MEEEWLSFPIKEYPRDPLAAQCRCGHWAVQPIKKYGWVWCSDKCATYYRMATGGF